MLGPATGGSQPEAARRVGALFSEFLRSLHLLRRPPWVELELTMAQLKALLLVASSGGLTGRELARRLGVGPPAVTALVDRLVQHGYARREEDPRDRRVTWTRPTAAGLALYEQLEAVSREPLEDVLASLTPSELELVERALELLRRAARQHLARGGEEEGEC